MLVRLIRYELKKTLDRKFFLFAFAALLIVNIALNCGFQEFAAWKDSVEQGTAIGSVDEKSSSFWESQKDQHRHTNHLRAEYRQLQKMSQLDKRNYENAMTHKYGPDAFDSLIPTEKMMEVPGYFGGETCDFDFILLYHELTEINAEQNRAIDRVLRDARTFGREAVSEEDDYGVRRNQSIIKLYSQPRENITCQVRGWDDFLLRSQDTMLLVFLLVLLFSSGIFTSEIEDRTFLIVQTARYGKKHTAWAKYLAGVVAAVILTVIFQITALFSIWFKGGLMGAEQPIAVLEPLQLCPFPMCVWQ